MSALKSAASRATGAKSNSPVTIRSPFVLRNERNTDFLQLEAAFKKEWDPQGPTQTALVEQMIVCHWRLLRIWQTEVAGIDLQMDYQEIDEPCRGATAFKHLADKSKFLDLMQRYDRSLSRQFDRALVRLKELKKERRIQPEPEPDESNQPDTTKLQNEPAPAEPFEVIRQNEPEPLPEMRAVLPIDDARRLLAALGYNLDDPS